MKKLHYREARELVDAIIQEHGKDTVVECFYSVEGREWDKLPADPNYPNGHILSAMPAVEKPTPLCIVGHVYARFDSEFFRTELWKSGERVERMNTFGRLNLTRKAAHYLDKLQRIQDASDSWDNANRRAIDYANEVE